MGRSGDHNGQRPEANIAFVGTNRLPRSGRVFQLHTLTMTVQAGSQLQVSLQDISHLWFNIYHLPCDGWKASEGFFECFASCMVLELHGSSNSRRKKLGVGALASTFLGRFSVDFQADVGSLLVQGLRFLQHTFASVAKNARLE